MKGILYTLLIFTLYFSSGQQRYISSAIIAFSGGAYERTIRDINTALENESVLTVEEKSKAYFYRGIATARLHGMTSESGNTQNAYVDAFNDLRKVKSFNVESWGARTNKELESLFPKLKSEASKILEQSKQTQASRARRDLISSTLKHLNAAKILKDDYETQQMIGETYLALGDYYSNQDSDRSRANYRASLRYFESSLNMNNDCVSCINSLIVVSKKLSDDFRVKRYTQLIQTF
ncbi:MAG: hypothetical protein JXR03_06300 [Cyclobacteriaceae bacterium]